METFTPSIPSREKESSSSFAKRVSERCGLPIHRIPDADPDALLEGPIIATSNHGTLVYLDHAGQDEETGVDIYNKAVLVDRSSELEPADQDADGIMTNTKE